MIYRLLLLISYQYPLRNCTKTCGGWRPWCGGGFHWTVPSSYLAWEPLQQTTSICRAECRCCFSIKNARRQPMHIMCPGWFMCFGN